KVNGKISFDGGVPNGNNGGCFFEVLDDKDKIIARLFITSANPSGVDIRGNDQVIIHGADDDMKLIFSKIMPFSINATDGTITITYGDFAPVSTTKKIDLGSNWQNPAKVRMYFYTNGQADNYYRMINISELRFINNKSSLTPPFNYFRSKTTGSWNNPLTWEFSNDGANWNDAVIAPDTAANAIIIREQHVVTINGTETVDQLTIKKDGILNVAPNGAIIVNDGEGEDVQIEYSGKMVIKSDATGTGRIGRSAGTIKGDVTVERYLPAKTFASYRMLAPSVNTSSTIRDNWQEGVNNLNVKDNINLLPGYGTHITGSLPGINGFDASVTGKSSLFTFNQSTPGQGWAAINNTNVNKLDAKKGYLLFIRGNRSIDLNDESKTGNTTLRATGSILSGTVNYEALESGGRNSVIANPYASPINWVTLQAANSDQFENYYTLWDPNVGSKGGYVTVDATGTTSVRTSNATTEIQSGQAFIVKAKTDVTSPTFKIDEFHKSKTNNVNVFRATNEKVSKLYASLYYTDDNGKRSLGDGVLSRFDVDYASGLDGDDAGDISNFDENIAFERNGKSLSIESRPFANNDDTLFLNITNMKQQAYEWQFNASDFDSSTTTHAFLKDKYLGTEIPIELEGSTVIIFAITSDPASGDAKRFSIVFEKLKTLPVNMLSVKGYEYNNGVKVDWKTATEINMDKYQVERSIDGQVFTVAGALSAQGTSTSVNNYSWFDSKPAAGYNYYRIRSVSKNGTLQYSQVVRVLIIKGTAGITIFPVPVKGSEFNVKLNNLQRGNYTLRLINVAGQILINHRVEHMGGTSIEKISSNNLKSGTYQLQVIGDNYTQTQQIIKL
ncbi:MAG: T9SS type A sorting domain-containing protein, partial [Ferruginibacter sp.]|nr:T9SS type A sorting domain-containing protein [Ferruginibacter sp.]